MAQEQLSDELMQNGVPQHRATFGDKERIIFHVDMDCFFAAVVVRDNPHLRGKPLAITHSDEKGEISACSYEAKVCDTLPFNSLRALIAAPGVWHSRGHAGGARARAMPRTRHGALCV